MTESAFIKSPSVTPTIDADQTQAEWVNTNLAVLTSLMTLDNDESSYRSFFAALKTLIPFDRALILTDAGDGVRCIAADPATLVGGHWPDKSLPNVLQVRALSAEDAQIEQEFAEVLAGLADASGPALFLPIAVAAQPALLVLLREPHREGFTDSHLTMAKQCAMVALAMLAVRKGDTLQAEIERLRALVTQDDAEGAHLPDEGRLYRGIVDHLPIGVTVQDEEGRFVFANAMAVANFAMPAEALIGKAPVDLLPQAEAESRRDWERELVLQGKTATVETVAVDQDGERTWLTSYKPARVLDQTLLISSSIDITDYKQVERELAERAHVDELTGLPNRNFIQHHVEAIIRNDDGNRHFALAFIDLDNFKHINDYYSHAVGDAMLVKIGQRVMGHLRPSDMLARISGDEFLLLIDPLEGESQAKSIIDGLLDDLKRPFQIEAFEVFGSCSVGVSSYPEHGRSYERLRRNADSAMYRAKHVSKGGAVFFDLNLAEAVAARMEAEQRLRLAIRDRKFCCAFQPKVDIYTQKIVGFETLVRWRDDGGDIHPPSEFIGLAVELGLINPITSFALTEAINSMDRLDLEFGPDTNISVNVAAKQAGDVEFMQSLVQVIKASNRAERIIIEVTEEAFIARGTFQTEILPLLREIGVRVSIDDFGTGHSSLSTLADITADEIKIDRSLITAIHERPRNQSVLRAIESLGQALKMTIVAEGVETHEELAYLHAATRIRHVQGFHFARPFFLEDLGDGAGIMGRVQEIARGEPRDHGSAAPMRPLVFARLGG